jgi:hypothetical protein
MGEFVQQKTKSPLTLRSAGVLLNPPEVHTKLA